MKGDQDFTLVEALNYINQYYQQDKICEWTEAEKEKYVSLLEDLEASNGRNSSASTNQKGRALENLSTFLIEKSGGIFKIRQNLRTQTNEIDILVALSQSGEYLCNRGLLPSYYRLFVAECKNYDRAVSVTYVGKFCSLMLTTGCKLGILFSYSGVTGAGWNDANGLIRKFYLHKEKIEERYCLVDFNITHFRAIEHGDNLLRIIDDRIKELQIDTDYLSFVSKHPAEDVLSAK